MNFDVFGHWKGGAVRDAGDEAIREHGRNALDNIEIGGLESLYGANKEDVANYIKKKFQDELNNSPLRDRAIAAGLTGADGAGGADWGADRGAYLSKITQAEEAKTKANKEEERGYLADIRQEGYRRQDALHAHTASEAAADRTLTRDLNRSDKNLSMQMAVMNQELADKRMAYDRETRAMDKRDRAIASLMSGIGQLGGAFSL